MTTDNSDILAGEKVRPSARRRLPNRRRSIVHELHVDGHTYLAGVRFFDDGRPAELFLDGVKPGSAMASTLQDAAVVVSIALQSGVSAASLAKSTSRQPSLAWQPTAEPASVIGAALNLMAGMDGGDPPNAAG